MFSLLLDIMLSRSHIKIPSVSNGMGNLKQGFSFVKKKAKIRRRQKNRFFCRRLSKRQSFLWAIPKGKSCPSEMIII